MGIAQATALGRDRGRNCLTSAQSAMHLRVAGTDEFLRVQRAVAPQARKGLIEVGKRLGRNLLDTEIVFDNPVQLNLFSRVYEFIAK